MNEYSFHYENFLGLGYETQTQFFGCECMIETDKFLATFVIFKANLMNLMMRLYNKSKKKLIITLFDKI